jgi:hypothetical protein
MILRRSYKSFSLMHDKVTKATAKINLLCPELIKNTFILMRMIYDADELIRMQ